MTFFLGTFVYEIVGVVSDFIWHRNLLDFMFKSLKIDKIQVCCCMACDQIYVVT